MELDDERLARALAGVRGIEVGSAGVAAAISEIVSAIPPVLDVGGAGLMIVDADLNLRAIAWSDEAARVFETVQEDGGRGPCVQSLLTDTVVAVEDLSIDPRWPDVAQAAGPLGVRGVLGVPVHVDGENVGALNVYCTEPTTWSEEAIAAVAAFAAVLRELLSLAVVADKHEGIIEQLQQALESRVVIERAVGLVMGRNDVDAVEAFNVLRAKSRRERRRVYDVADDVLAGRASLD